MTRRRWRRRWAPSCLGVWGGLQSTTLLLPRKAAEDLAFGQAKLQQIGQKRVDLFQNCLFDTFSPSSSFYSDICCNFFVTRPRLRKVLGQPLWVQILFPLQNLTMPLPLETRPPQVFLSNGMGQILSVSCRATACTQRVLWSGVRTGT